MRKRNPTREITLSLVGAMLLGVAFFVYLKSTMKVPSPPVMTMNARTTAGTASQGPSRSDDARRIGAAFVQHLASSRHEDAYALMASAYRQNTPFEAFRTSCAASPFLASAESASLSKTREESAAAEPGRRSLTATGVMNTKAGTVDVTFWFVEDPTGVAIVNLTVAGSPSLPMGAETPSAKPLAAKPAITARDGGAAR